MALQSDLCREGGDLAFKASLLLLAFLKLPTLPLTDERVVQQRYRFPQWTFKLMFYCEYNMRYNMRLS